MPEDSPWGRPFTGTPLDYVPVEAPATKSSSIDFKSPVVRRALIAGAFTGVVIAGFEIPAFGLTLLAIAIIGFAVWGAGKLADKLNDHY